MPQIVELPEGQRLEFPDGMSQVDMAAAIEKNFYSKPQRVAPTEQPLIKPTASENDLLRQEQTELRNRDEGGFAAKAFGIAENIVRPFANPLRATEELIEGAAAATGLAKPGSKLLVSPDREIGRAVNRLGEVASGVVEDIAAFVSADPKKEGLDESLSYLGNTKAAFMGLPRPAQEAIKQEGGWEKFIADVSTTISHITPQIVLQRGLAKAGLSESAAAGAAFGFTPEGFDPKTALIMAAFPGVSHVGRDMALKAVGERVGSDTARNAIGMVGSYVAAQAYMDLSSAPDYATMTPEEAKAAWVHNFGVNLAFHLGHIPGMTKQALGEITKGKEFQQAVSESALEIAAREGLPSNAQQTVSESAAKRAVMMDRAREIGPATTAAIADDPASGQIVSVRGQTVSGKPLALLDKPAETLKPEAGGGAETITRPDERTGSEMRAEREERPIRRSPKEDRPWDIIDELESQLGGKLSLKKARELIEDFKPTGALRKLFAADGYAPDVAAQSVSGFKKLSDVELLEALQSAASARKGARAAKSAEAEQLRVEEKQLEQFESKALRGERPAKESDTVERVPVQDLFVGEKFKVQNHEFEVTDMEIDPDGRLLSLTVKDGPKFGVQTITPEVSEFIFVDKGTFKPVEKSTDFAPAPEPEPAKPEPTVEPPKAEAEPPPQPKRRAGDDLFGGDTPFNLVGEKVAAEKPKETTTGFGDDTLAQQEMFSIQKIVEAKDPGRSADAAQKLYGSAKEAAAKIRKQMDVIDSDPETRKAFVKEQRERLKEVLNLLEQRASKEAKGDVVLESRIETGRRGKARDVFEMDEGDLADLFEERFGTRERGEGPLSAGRGGQFNFKSFEEFRDWMDARYAERDIEGMKLAFAEAGTAEKVGYIKGNKGSDPHKRDWIAHLATGAPLPKESPPVTRTTPRPMPGGRSQPMPGPAPPGQPPPPSRPAGPPPPPRRPSLHRKFDVMALTQLFRQFSGMPVVNTRLRSAYGRFVPDTKAVELKERLLWDTALAERVLGHEIGHFIDLIVKVSGKGRQFANRLKPLYDFRGKMWEKQELRQQARSLSRDWRGNFPDGDRYRDSANELFADFMSAMFNKPEWVNKQYPKLHDAFQDFRDGKPQFKSAYREIETWLQGDTMVDEWMGQQRDAVNRTMDDLLKKREETKASLADRLKFGTLSLWQRAFEKEGKPRELGQSITDELEYNKTWAAKENALFADDFTKLVEPELAKVAKDPVEARTHLLSYSQAMRTIGERRAAGKWIEDNPAEAREMLEMIVDLDASIRSKFGDALSRASDAELYDLSAAMFREIHDRGERFVTRMAREIDELNLGVSGEAALVAFNVRGKLLNPGGLTEANALKVRDKLSNQLGPDKFAALETAAKNLRDLMFDVQSKMHAEGLISDKAWKELIEPNRDNYLPYAVLDYWEGRVRAGVLPQKGTAKDIADIAASTQLKIAASNVWRQQQRQVQLLRDAYRKGGVTIPIGEKLRRSSDIEKIRQRHSEDDTSRAVIWQDGKPHVVEFPGDRGKLLEAAMEQPAFYEHISWIAEASDMTHKVMQFYTQWSVPFLFWRNPVRGARTSALKVGFGRIGQQMTPKELRENLRLARNYADAAFGKPLLPEVRELVDRQVLLPPRLSQAMVRDSANLRQMLSNHTILANQVRGLNAPRWWLGGKLGRKGVEVSEKVFTGYEAFEKIYNYRAALEKGLTPAQATAIGRRAGIPKPGVGGKWSLAMEVWFPWTRVHIQGARATYDMLRDPKLRKGFAARFALTEALPRVAKVAIGAGLAAGTVNWLMRDDEDKNDTVMAEVMRRVSPYKMALDDVVPLMLYDTRKGEYHYFWNYKKGGDIPKHFEVVSLRIPASEEGRLWGSLLYNTMISTPGAKDKLSRPGQGAVGNLGQWAVNYLAPGLSPIIETSDALKDMVLLGRNPQDPYRGQPAANPKLFDAGGTDRAQAIAGYVLNQGGSVGELAGVLAANFGLLDDRALNALNQRLSSDKRPWDEKVPFLKTAVSHDNYAQYREEKGAELAEKQLRAKARLVMPEEVRSLYDFYYRNVDRQAKMTDVELDQFEVAKDFVQNVWGSLTIDGEPNSDSFYSKAAHAVGKDGSREAKRTVQRDLTAAAAGHIASFLELNAGP
jgi:hypothetical protein